MHRSFKRAALLSAIGLLAGCAGNSTSLPAAGGNIATQSIAQFPAANVFKSCATVLPGDDARCYAQVRTDVRGIGPNSTPSGFGPSSLQSAYALPSSTNGAGQTVGIVDAYDDPNAESDLGVYRAQYGLPPCTTANGCFTKYTQRGRQHGFPAENLGWAQESALDLDMASAMCPNCKIILVEANTNSFGNLAKAEDTAAAKGAHVISNSYGGGESGSQPYEKSYNHAGVAITASTGDAGYGAQFPATSPHVTAVGGTDLFKDAGVPRGWRETAWIDGGSGCSVFYAKPTWQTDTGCTMRMEADVAADADPGTGVAVYGPTSTTASGWQVYGGTSVAAPMVGGIYANNGGSVNYGSNPYANTGALNDITTGGNGKCPGEPAYYCHAEVGYDGPTGLGTPIGNTAF